MARVAARAGTDKAPGPSVFDFVDVRSFLQAVLERKKTRNPRFSIRAWSRQVGLKSPTLLINILSGERKVSVSFGAKIARTLELDATELRYFKTLVLANQATSEEARDEYQKTLSELRPDPTRLDLKLDHFRLIADWHHLAILELLALRDVSFEPAAIARTLRNKVNVAEVSSAIAALVRLGLLQKENGRYRRGAGNPVLKGEVPHEAIKSHHRQLLTRASEALVEQPVAERDFRATKIALRRADYGKAKEIIMEFHKKMQMLSVTDDGDDVYAFNTQFFKLTDRE